MFKHFACAAGVGFQFCLMQRQNGPQGYQWGNILSAPNYELEGTFNEGC